MYVDDFKFKATTVDCYNIYVDVFQIFFVDTHSMNRLMKYNIII